MKKIDASTPVYPDFFVLVDDEDYDRVINQGSWRVISGYAQNIKRTGDRSLNKRKGIRLHRFILRDYDVSHCIDFKNGDKRDNRKCNLRVISKKEDCWRSKGWKEATSMYKGVGWENYTQKWKAQIHVNGVGKNLGRYTSELEAAEAYNTAAVELCGEFARLNAVHEAELLRRYNNVRRN